MVKATNRGAFGAIFASGLALFIFTSCSTLGTTTKAPAEGKDLLKVEDSLSPIPQESTVEQLKYFNSTSADPYVIAPGDILEISSESGEFSAEVAKVAPEGVISLSKIGWVPVAGMNITQAEESISSALSRIYSSGVARVVVNAAPSRKITLLGSVKNPGIFVLDGPLTLVDAIAKAGGLTEVSTDRRPPMEWKLLCRVVRPDVGGVWIDLRRVLFGNDSELNLKLKSGDILYVYKR